MKRSLYTICLLLIGHVWPSKAMEQKPYNVLFEFQQGNALIKSLCQKPINEENVKELLKNGVDVNFQTKYGNTPLHIAWLSKNMNIIQLLLPYNPNPYISMIDTSQSNKSFYAKSILESMEETFKEEIEENEKTLFRSIIATLTNNILKSTYYKNGNELITAINENQHKNNIKKLLNASADPNFTNAYGNSPLNTAVERNNIPLVKLLINYNAFIDHNACDIHTEEDGTIHGTRSTLSILTRQQRLYNETPKAESSQINKIAKIIKALGASIPKQPKQKSRSNSTKKNKKNDNKIV